MSASRCDQRRLPSALNGEVGPGSKSAPGMRLAGSAAAATGSSAAAGSAAASVSSVSSMLPASSTTAASVPTLLGATKTGLPVVVVAGLLLNFVALLFGLGADVGILCGLNRLHAIPVGHPGAAEIRYNLHALRLR